MTIRRSPLGYLIEEGPTGDLFLHEAHELWAAVEQARKECSYMADATCDRVTVYLSRRDAAGPENHDEWGSGPDFETAMRYALGAYFGSFEDPIVEYDPLLAR